MCNGLSNQGDREELDDLAGGSFIPLAHSALTQGQPVTPALLTSEFTTRLDGRAKSHSGRGMIKALTPCLLCKSSKASTP